MALIGFLLGYATDTERGALVGQLLNFTALALLVVWTLVLITRAAT